MFYVYVLYSDGGKFYIGYTGDLRRRFREHRAKKVYSTRLKCYKLVYYEAYCNKMDAVGREKFLKGGSGHIYLKKQLAYFLGKN